MDILSNPGTYYRGYMRTGNGVWTSVTPLMKSLQECIKDMESLRFKPWVKYKDTGEAKIVQVTIEDTI